MKVCLVAMPWHRFNAPQASLGVLAAFLRRDFPMYKVDCRYAYLSVWEKLNELYEQVSLNVLIGEFVYGAHLYPDSKELFKEGFVKQYERRSFQQKHSLSYGEMFDHIMKITEDHLDTTVAMLANEYDVVGLSVSFSQLFASLVVAKRLKELSAETYVVLGGGSVTHIGASLLKVYPFIDTVIRGEGEAPLAKLLDNLEKGITAHNHPSIISRNLSDTQPFEDEESPNFMDLNSLPAPDYSEYYRIAEQLEILWEIPIEGSRGCYWNRSYRTKSHMDACHFCGLNHSPYRQKKAEQVVSEMDGLANLYQNIRFRFVDNVFRLRGESLAKLIASKQKDFIFFLEVRADIDPKTILLLWEAGCTNVQIGIEGLSTSYLKRLNKGTTTILNLQAMKTCFEFGIENRYNIISNFPGATKKEVEETARNIRDFATAYAPPFLRLPNYTVDFHLDKNSAVYHNPHYFGVTNFRIPQDMAVALPKEVASRIELPWSEFDYTSEPEDWQPVVEEIENWHKRYNALSTETQTTLLLPKPLYYFDGGTFLEIVDRRHGLRLITLDSLWRQIYLFCMRVRTISQITERFVNNVEEEATIKEEILPGLINEKLMFEEQGQYLSLAVAWRADVTAKRIRADR